MLALLLSMCLWLPPVPGPVVADFAPDGIHAGHWGIDVAIPAGTEVLAPVDGVVTFAGSVAGMNSVTLLIGADIRVSLSYLSVVAVAGGQEISAGEPVGRSGRAHGEQRLHVSMRVGGTYVDPGPYLACSGRASGTIRLLLDP